MCMIHNLERHKVDSWLPEGRRREEQEVTANEYVFGGRVERGVVKMFLVAILVQLGEHT